MRFCVIHQRVISQKKLKILILDTGLKITWCPGPRSYPWVGSAVLTFDSPFQGTGKKYRIWTPPPPPQISKVPGKNIEFIPPFFRYLRINFHFRPLFLSKLGIQTPLAFWVSGSRRAYLPTSLHHNSLSQCYKIVNNTSLLNEHSISDIWWIKFMSLSDTFLHVLLMKYTNNTIMTIADELTC